MRPTRIAVAVVALLAIAGSLCAVLARLDPESVRAQIRARLDSAQVAQVEIGEAELVWLPPAVLVRDVRVAAAPALRISAAELRVGVSLSDLLRGRVTPTSARAAGGTLEIGSLRLDRVAWSGALGSGPDYHIHFTAHSAELGPIERGRLVIGDIAAPVQRWRWSARGELPAVEVARTGERLGVLSLSGRAAGRFDAAGRGATAERASLALESGDLALAGARHRISGAAALSADLSGAFAIDLGAASVRIGGFEKPPGVALRVSGVRSQRELRIESQALRAVGDVDLAAETLDLRVGSIDLAALATWSAPSWVPRSGRVEIAGARLAGSPLAVHASGDLVDVAVPVPRAEQVLASVSGRVATDGRELRAESLRVGLAGEPIEVSGRYDWVEPHVELAISVRGSQLGALAEALWGRTDLSGRLYGHVEVAGPPDPLALTGSGAFELADGELPGISLARAAGLAPSVDDETEPPGLDRFDALAASFAIAGDRLDVSEATLVAAYTTAAVSGQFYLRDSTADLAGAVQFDHPLVSASTTRPILRMAGRLDALETHVSDAKTDDVREMEAAMIEAIRKVEAERRADAS